MRQRWLQRRTVGKASIRVGVILFTVSVGMTMVACESSPGVVESDEKEERARLVQCCQALAHEAWNSDPPNSNVLHAARDCEALARQGHFEQARTKLRAAGHATACEGCPPNGCRP
ncbi:MAG TPA: hypothetical protein PKL73_01730 [Polyangiaceae bacterium]|nr:hypothetical protein [Polyangiaceae bacterium]HNZ25273.1 hypothetical protein [Polyangiaceae bacterium]HOD23120.1 hypothetical protein [Polyangiaceae bacterium]HOE50867.1 hypothetical protein [Polyangiaceae bacterium]HOH03372.1 hypothetical protein [Polyangiaceae bacterium]